MRGADIAQPHEAPSLPLLPSGGNPCGPLPMCPMENNLPQRGKEEKW